MSLTLQQIWTIAIGAAVVIILTALIGTITTLMLSRAPRESSFRPHPGPPAAPCPAPVPVVARPSYRAPAPMVLFDPAMDERNRYAAMAVELGHARTVLREAHEGPFADWTRDSLVMRAITAEEVTAA